MGRRALGWTLRWHDRAGAWQVRYRLHGQRYERSTGIRDRRQRREAQAVAERIFREARHAGGVGHVQCTAESITEQVGKWLDDLPVREATRESYTKHAAAWCRGLGRLSAFSERGIAAWIRQRLREVSGKSVRNEASTLRRFCAWMVETGQWREAPRIPPVRASETGQPSANPHRVPAPEVSPREVERILAALPARARRGGWPVRARFVLQYETTLRPEALHRLSVPQNYARGSALLTLTNADDKELYGREVPLTKRARKALDAVCPKRGLIFGRHRYTGYLRMAAAKVLPEHKARYWAGQHFRSAAITHLLEDTGDMPGVQHMAGHRHTSTTARYVRPSLRAAKAVVRKRDRQRRP